MGEYICSYYILIIYKYALVPVDNMIELELLVSALLEFERLPEQYSTVEDL